MWSERCRKRCCTNPTTTGYNALGSAWLSWRRADAIAVGAGPSNLRKGEEPETEGRSPRERIQNDEDRVECLST